MFKFCRFSPSRFKQMLLVIIVLTILGLVTACGSTPTNTIAPTTSALTRPTTNPTTASVALATTTPAATSTNAPATVGNTTPTTATGATATSVTVSATVTTTTGIDPQAAKVQDPTVRRWVEAVNSGNQTAFEATFAPNAYLVDSGRRFEGVAAIRNWSNAELLGANGRIEVLCQETSPNGLTLNVKYSSRVYNGPGRYVFVVQDNMVQGIEMVPPVASACQPAQVSSMVVASTPSSATTTTEQARETVVRQFVDAANRGDADGVAKSFAPNARFDSVGRIYQGRNQIMNRFLVPEVLNIKGRYEILSVRHDPDAVTFEFNFRAGSLFEHFTYRCVIQNGEIQDVVGRYV